MGVARLILLIVFFVLLTLITLEFVRRGKLSTLVSPGQFRLRIVIAFLFLLEIALMLAGTYILEGVAPLLQILYWTGCLILALIMIVAAVLDVRGIMINYLVERRAVLKKGLENRRDD